MRLIDADALYEKILKMEKSHHGIYIGLYNYAKVAIKEAPEVEQIKHGRFLYRDKRNADIIAQCSCCGKWILTSDAYCGKCGAKMDGKDGSCGN